MLLACDMSVAEESGEIKTGSVPVFPKSSGILNLHQSIIRI